MATTTLPDKIPVPSIPSVPNGTTEDMRSFLSAVKTLLETREGVVGDEMNAVVLKRDIQNLGIAYQFLFDDTPNYEFNKPVGTGPPPTAPTNLAATNYLFANKLVWDNPNDSEVSHIQIWASKDSVNLSDAELIGNAVYPFDDYENNLTGEYFHHAIDVNSNYYYWIRAISWAGVYSTWEPSDLQGGYLVPSAFEDTINESWSKLLQYDGYNSEFRVVADSFQVIQPSNIIAAYVAATVYPVNELVLYNNLYWKSLQAANQGNTPVEGAWWTDVTDAVDDAKTVFIISTIDSITSVGINGGLIVDGTIVANAISADAINGVHIDATSQITLGTGGHLLIDTDATIRVGGSQGGTTDQGMYYDGAGSFYVSGDITIQNVIDTEEGGLIVRNVDTGDYAKLASGDMIHYYNTTQDPLDIQAVEYNAITRVEVNPAPVLNASIVTLPGIWKQEPRIIVSPSDMELYNEGFRNQNQRIVCQAFGLKEVTDGSMTYQFQALAELFVGAASPAIPVNFNGFPTTPIYTSQVPSNTSKISVPCECWAYQTHIDAITTTIYGYDVVLKLYGGRNNNGEALRDTKTFTTSNTSATHIDKTLSWAATNITSFYVTMAVTVRFPGVHVATGDGIGNSIGFKIPNFTATLAADDWIADGYLNYIAIGV